MHIKETVVSQYGFTEFESTTSVAIKRELHYRLNARIRNRDPFQQPVSGYVPLAKVEQHLKEFGYV